MRHPFQAEVKRLMTMRPSLSGGILGLVVAFTLVLAERAFAQSDSTSLDSLANIDQRLRILERQQEIDKEAIAAKSTTTPTNVAGPEGFSWKSADGAYSLRMRGYVHSDGRFFIADSLRQGTSILSLRRIRPIFEVTVAKRFDFRIMPDWGGGTAVLQDGYVEFRASPKFKLRTGKFKPPVGFERLQSATELVFVERALPTNLVPNRDLGFQVSGDLAEAALTYAVGIFNGAPDGGSVDTDINDNKEVMGRVFVSPFKKSMSRFLPGLGLGISASVGENKGTAGSTGLGQIRSAGQQTIFGYRSDGLAAGTVVAQGRRLRWSPQGSWYWERVGFQAEYVESSQEIAFGTDRLDHESRASQFTGSLLLTSDTYTSRGVNPKRPFDLDTGAWGAIALDGRYSKLNVEGSAFPIFANPTSSVTSAREWGAGLTWFMNRHVKLVCDYGQTEFEGGAPPTVGGDRETEKVLAIRSQYTF